MKTNTCTFQSCKGNLVTYSVLYVYLGALSLHVHYNYVMSLPVGKLYFACTPFCNTLFLRVCLGYSCAPKKYLADLTVRIGLSILLFLKLFYLFFRYCNCVKGTQWNGERCHMGPCR